MKFKISQDGNDRSQTIDLSRALRPPARVVPICLPRDPNIDERQLERRRVSCPCKLFSENKLIRSALIVDITKSGVRVKFRVKGTLPRYLHIEAESLGLKRRVRVIWQDSHSAGLQFVMPPENKQVSLSGLEPEDPKTVPDYFDLA